MRFICVAFLFCFVCFANETPEESLANMTKITPSFESEDMYGAMEYTLKNPTNNLRRLVGSPFFAQGVPLYIEGRVFDISGDPIKDVTIQITQTNHYGSYNFLIDKESAVYDENFSSGGVSVTNNLGEYNFLTIMPGHYGNRAPHIHFNIKHQKFELETEMFFENHPLNEMDSKYQKLNKYEQKACTGRVYYINSQNMSEGMEARFDIYINNIF
jgi:protocatechuate 3,4-dioxygenase beta subunit